MYEASPMSVLYDPAGFKRPLSGTGISFDPLVMQGKVSNAPRQSVSPSQSKASSDEDGKTERQALLDEAKRIRVEERKNPYLWLSFWTTVFGLLMMGLVFYATRRRVPTDIHEILEKSTDKFAAQWDSKMGVKECNRLDKKFLVFHHQLSGANISSWSLQTPSVFFLQDDRDLSHDQACSIESFANLLAELVVYALRLKCAKSPSETPSNNLKRLLADEYKNLIPLTVDGNTYFRGTPFAGAFQCRSRRSLDLAMVITVWRFGGISVYPDIILKGKEFINFPSNQIHLSRHFIVSYHKCAPPLFYLMTRLAASLQTNFEIQTIAKEGFDALCCSGICPDVVTNDKSICDDRCPMMLVENLSVAAQHCPRTWKEVGESFRGSQAPSP